MSTIMRDVCIGKHCANTHRHDDHDAPSESACIATPGHVGTCPRHSPETYAEQQAKHATDSYPLIPR